MQNTRQTLVILITSFLTGCQVINAPNAPATLGAQNTALIQESTALPEALAGTASVISRTVVVAETKVAEVNSINRQLVATMKVVIVPTPAPQIAPVANSTLSGTAASTGSSLVDIGVTSRKRESDGCADGTQSQFLVDTPIIYAIARAPSIISGAKVAVEWKYQGQVVGSGSYDVTADQTNYCIWFPLDPATIPFTQGSWSVQFSLDSQPVEPTIFFNIGEVATPVG